MALLIRLALGIGGTIVALNVLSPSIGQKIQQDFRSIALIAGIVTGVMIGARGN